MTPAANPPPPPRAWHDAAWLLALAAPALLVCVVVAMRRWEIGIADEWTWPYFEHGDIAALLWAASAAIGLCALLPLGVCLALRHGIQSRADEAVALGLFLVLAYGVITHTAKIGPRGDVQDVLVTATPWIGGYYGEAARVTEMKSYLAGYAAMIGGLSVKDPFRGHVADHPAAPVVFHWLVHRTLRHWPGLARAFLPADPETLRVLRPQVERLTRAPVSDAELAGLWASAFLLRLALWLSLIPLYLLARDLYGRECALVALALAALIPSLHLFGPYMDQTLVCFAAWAVYAWHRAMLRKRIGWALLAGAAVLAGMLWSLSLLLAAALMGLATAISLWRERCAEGRIAWRPWARIIFAGAAAFLALSLLPMILFDYDTWSVWRVCLTQHATFSGLFRRSYLPWLFFNPLEFSVFCGVPIAAACAAQAVCDARRWWPARRVAALDALPWALLGVLAAANFSGKNLGETARLWMFLMPFATPPAAAALMRLDRHRGWPCALAVGLLAAQLLVFKLTLNVFTI